MNREELYLVGKEMLRKFYDTAAYGGGGEMHSADYKQMIVEQYFVPAANQGCVEAMKECGDHYLSTDKMKAALYYKMYVDHYPGNSLSKLILKSQIAARLLKKNRY